MSHQDDVFVQVFLLVMGGLVLFAVGIFVIANSISTKLAPVEGGGDYEAIAARIQPVGQVAVSGIDELPPPKPVVMVTKNASPPDAATIVEQNCSTCHATGIAGAPKLGVKADWEPRQAKGLDALVESVVNGLGVMPAKGGTSYDANALKRAVQYMLDKAGLGTGTTSKEATLKPTVLATPPATTLAPVSPVVSEPVMAPEPIAPVVALATATPKPTPTPDLAKGEEVYKNACMACHGFGVANAPKIGDKANWGPRIKQGMATLVDHANKGFQGKVGRMLPKGGHADLSDQEVAAAVAYMVSQSQ